MLFPQIEEVFGRARQGVFAPFKCAASNGKSYFVKGAGSGIRGLVCEYVCGRLAQFLELPIPPFVILESSKALIENSLVPGINELGADLAFGSEAIEAAKELTYTRLNVTSVDLQQRILVFDWWIRNEDRKLTSLGGNPNMIMDSAEQKLYIIDHHSAFDPEFNVSDFLSSHAFSRHKNLFSDDDFQTRHRTLLLGALANLESIFKDVPNLWMECFEDEREHFDIDEIRRTLNNVAHPDFWVVAP